jgi:hypothetical protein
MIPISQTILSSEGVVGNCFQCCVASVLELPLEEVPHFCKEDSWPLNFHEWLNSRGYFWIEVVGCNSHLFIEYSGYHIISGPSPRNKGLHGVVGLNGEPHFDPHPDKTFLKGEPKDWMYGFLVRKL